MSLQRDSSAVQSERTNGALSESRTLIGGGGKLGQVVRSPGGQGPSGGLGTAGVDRGTTGRLRRPWSRAQGDIVTYDSGACPLGGTGLGGARRFQVPYACLGFYHPADRPWLTAQPTKPNGPYSTVSLASNNAKTFSQTRVGSATEVRTAKGTNVEEQEQERATETRCVEKQERVMKYASSLSPASEDYFSNIGHMCFVCDKREVSFNNKVIVIKFLVFGNFQKTPKGVQLRDKVVSGLSGEEVKNRKSSHTLFGVAEARKAALQLQEEVRTDSAPAMAAWTNRWIIDTGSGHHLIASDKVGPESRVSKTAQPLVLATANGRVDADVEAEASVGRLQSSIRALVLDKTPNVLSMGRLVRDQGYSLQWRADDVEHPRLISPLGRVVKLQVINDVPVLPAAEELVEEPEAGVSDVEVSGASDRQIGARWEDGVLETVHPESVDVLPEDDKEVSSTNEMLKQEALSLHHLLTHSPKNPFCEACLAGKLRQKAARRKLASNEKSLQVSRFGEGVRMDHVVLRESTEGIDGDRGALVLQDIFSGYVGFYPAKDRTVDECIRALRHFVGTIEVIFIQSDNAREFLALARELNVAHSSSTPYRHQSNAHIERQIGVILQLTRVLLHQSGARLATWPWAGRFAAWVLNTRGSGEGTSAYKKRFACEASAELFPYGCRILYRNPNQDSTHKFAPIAEEGVMLGIHLSPGHVWHGDYVVANLATLMSTDQSVWSVLRTREVIFPEHVVFPLKQVDYIQKVERYKKVNKKNKSRDIDFDDHDTIPEQLLDDRPFVVESSGAGELHHIVKKADMEFVRPWRAFDLCVKPKRRGDLVPPAPRRGSKRPSWLWPDEWAGMHRTERERYLRQIYKPTEDEESKDQGREQNSMSVNDQDVREQSAPPDDASGMPGSGVVEDDALVATKIQKSVVSKNVQKRMKKKRKFLENVSLLGTGTGLEFADGTFYEDPVAAAAAQELSNIPPSIADSDWTEGHRIKAVPSSLPSWALVTRQVKPNSAEFKSEGCKKALQEELDKLRRAGVWDENDVFEWPTLVKETEKTGRPMVVGRLFPIMGMKNAELAGTTPPPGSPVPKYKGRIVFDGRATHVKTSTGQSPVELYTEISQTPATMNAVRIALTFACSRKLVVSVRDAQQAYIQAKIVRKGAPETFIRLPRPWWPRWWHGKFQDPVCRLIKALYGHPESGAIWQVHLDVRLKALGWQMIRELPSAYRHLNREAMLVVYVDDLLIVCKKDEKDLIWSEIDTAADFAEDPEDLDRFLGTYFSRSDGKDFVEYSISMNEFLVSAYKEFEAQIKRPLTPASTPYLFAEPIPEDQDPVGALQPVAAKYLMKLLYGARMARPDLCTAITRLASFVSRWKQSHDRMLCKLMAFVKYSCQWQLTGRVQCGCNNGYLRMYADSDYAGDKSTTKSYSGLWLEYVSGGFAFPIAWSSKKQSFTATSSAEAETAALAYFLKKEAWPCQEAYCQILGRDDVRLEVHEDNMQVLQNIKSGYSANLRCMSRTFRTSVGVLYEAFSTPRLHSTISYINTKEQKADLFTKPLQRSAFLSALELISLKRVKNSELKGVVVEDDDACASGSEDVRSGHHSNLPSRGV